MLSEGWEIFARIILPIILVGIGSFISWFLVHNYQQTQDKIVKREKIIDEFQQFISRFERRVWYAYSKEEDGHKEISNNIFEMNKHFQRTNYLIKLYFKTDEDIEQWNVIQEKLLEKLTRVEVIVNLDEKFSDSEYKSFIDYAGLDLTNDFIDVIKFARFH